MRWSAVVADRKNARPKAIRARIAEPSSASCACSKAPCAASGARRLQRVRPPREALTQDPPAPHRQLPRWTGPSIDRLTSGERRTRAIRSRHYPSLDRATDGGSNRSSGTGVAASPRAPGRCRRRGRQVDASPRPGRLRGLVPRWLRKHRAGICGDTAIVGLGGGASHVRRMRGQISHRWRN